MRDSSICVENGGDCNLLTFDKFSKRCPPAFVLELLELLQMFYMGDSLLDRFQVESNVLFQFMRTSS